MAIEHRTTERDMVGRVAITAQRQVSTGHHKFELVVHIAEERDGLCLAITASIVFELLANPLVPLRVVESEEDRLDHVPLIGREEVSAHGQ